MDQMKKAFKGLFRGKKSKKQEPQPTATSEAATTPAQTKPTETTPAAPAPATAPEPAKTETTPAVTSGAPAAPAQPAAAPASDAAQGEVKKDEAAALTEVKNATSSRLSSRSDFSPLSYSSDDACHGSRRRQKVDLDNQWKGPI
jgi:hypothetical protein